MSIAHLYSSYPSKMADDLHVKFEQTVNGVIDLDSAGFGAKQLISTGGVNFSRLACTLKKSVKADPFGLVADSE